MDWLERWGVPCLRINEDNPLVDLDLDPTDPNEGWIGFSSGAEVQLRDIHACWMRRGGPTLELLEGPPLLVGSLQREWAAVMDLLLWRLEALPGLGTARPPSRLVQMQVARQVGWEVPRTRVSTRKEVLMAFISSQWASITRAIEGPLVGEGGLIGAGTLPLTRAELAPLASRIVPALAQARVEKVWELRVYFLAGRCFAGAMMAGPLDIRQGVESPRMVPYQLPQEVEGRIGRLMKALRLSEGSLDLLVTADDRFFFLEVNAHGQLHGLAQACRFPIEEAIARHLADGRARG